MATSQTSTVIQHLRRAVLLRDGAGLTDGQLLEDYISRREEAALAALVHRHGPMVWGVCRRVLRNWHDAEDAFQATFLVLVRKAGSIASPELLANWLYGVAHQTALKARATNAKRSARERQVTEMPEPAVTEQVLWNDLQPLLDQELSRLPDKYRVAIVLCDLEGKTRQEAARRLGCPEGTLAAQLARGRVMLAKRLARRGVVLSGGLLATVLAHGAASACVPTSVVSSTIKAATLFAAGQAAASGVISAKVAALTEGVLKTMLLTKLKIATALLLAVAVVAAGASLVRLPVLAAEPPQPPKTDRPATQDAGKPQTAPKPVVVREDAFLSRLAWSSGGEVVATVGMTYEVVEVAGEKVLVASSTIKLWDASTGKLKRSLEEEKNTSIKALAFSPDKKTVAITAWKPLKADEDNKTEVRLVDAETWALKHKVDDVSLAGVLSWSAVAFSPDGTRLALGGYEKGSFVKMWDVKNNKLIEPKTAPEDPGIETHVHCLAFSPDGKVVAAGDRDAKIRLFDGQSGEPKAVLDEHSAEILGITFSPDGKTLVSGSADKTVKLWDVPAGKLRRTLKGNKGNIWAVASSPDGRLLATGGTFMQEKDKLIGEVILWDAKTGELKQTLPDLTVPVYTLAFSPDGKTLAIGGGTDPVLPDLKDGGKTSGEMKLVRLSH